MPKMLPFIQGRHQEVKQSCSTDTARRYSEWVWGQSPVIRKPFTSTDLSEVEVNSPVFLKTQGALGRTEVGEREENPPQIIQKEEGPSRACEVPVGKGALSRQHYLTHMRSE